METILVIMLFILFLVAFPLLFEVRVYANLLENFGMITLRVFGLRVYFAKLKIKGKTLIITTKKKRKSQDIEVSSQEIDFATNFYKQLTEVVALRKLCFYTKVGTKNPLVSAMLGGICQLAINALAITAKNSKNHSDVVVVCGTDFARNCAVISLRVRCFITLIDVGLSFIKAKKQTKKQEQIKWKKKLNRQR